MPGPARRTAEEVVLALTDAGFFRIFTDQIRWLRGGHPNRGYADRARSRAMGGYAAQQTLEAIHTLLNVHGAGGFAEKNRMQQYRRDAYTAARHPGLNAVVGREVSGKSLLAVEERISPVV
jgi:3-hydroxy-9,10-secoandrosta-1,3,5(10)-triene-9,17-dione monooxygenase